MIRSHLYAWAVCVISTAKNKRKINSEIIQELSDRYQNLRQTNKGKDCLMRILFKATRMLFYELRNELK